MFESYESSDNARFIIIDAFNLGSRLNFMKAKEETVYPVMTFKPINKALSLSAYTILAIMINIELETTIHFRL